MLTQERPATKTEATIDDLYRVPGKAEIVNGEIVLMSPTGAKPGRAAGRIFLSLSQHEQVSIGYAFGDSVGFIVRLPHRRSFSPDAVWYTGDADDLESMKFLPQAPAFAAEVRSEGDYGPQAERDILAKIADYFAAGTQVVWDVDLQSADIVRKHIPAAPTTPFVFRAGDVADAEPAVPGWRLPVDDLLAALIRPRRP